MRILFNDFPGHPGFGDLCREIAARGVPVQYVYCSTMDSPHGDLDGLPDTMEVVDVRIGDSFPKHQPLRRIVAEFRFGWRSARASKRFRPDVFVANQMPVISQVVHRLLCPRLTTVVWLQDLQGGLATMAPVAGARCIGSVLAAIERWTLRRADLVMPISEQMAGARALAEVKPERVVLRPNWGDPDDVQPGPKDSAFAHRHGLVGRPVALYAGTLGIKHDPDLPLVIARRLQRELPDARMVVVSSGPLWYRLVQTTEAEGLDTLVCLPLMAFDQVPGMLSAADVLVASLKVGAATFSVPSKVLNYLCAGRPVAALVPHDSPITALVNVEACAGLASESMDEVADFVVEQLRSPGVADGYGRNARAYAEANFSASAAASELLDLWQGLKRRETQGVR